MAIATATILAGAALASTAATTGMSFAQAGKQRKAQGDAERDADQAMQEARKKLEINFYDQLSIQKEPYELEREALLAQGAQAIQAGVESERGAAATAGRIQMAQQEGQAGVRSAFGQELSALEKLSAQEDSRLRDVGAQLDLGEVAGAQLAAANAQELGAQATQQAMQGVQSMGKQIASFSPLYEKTKESAIVPNKMDYGTPLVAPPLLNNNNFNQFMQQQQANQINKNFATFQANPFNPFYKK